MNYNQFIKLYHLLYTAFHLISIFNYMVVDF